MNSMTPAQIDYYQRVIKPLEAKLLALELEQLFTGQLYDINDELIPGLDLPELGPHGLQLTAVDVGRLFMAPDESVVSFARLADRGDGTPAGMHVRSENPFVQEGEQVDIVAYADQMGTGVRIDALYLSRVMLAEDAPQRLCTVAFGLMACTAFRLDFAEVTLYAGGRGYGDVPLDKDDLVGYQVWPKFGFDAALVGADLDRAPAHLVYCRTVLDVMARDQGWWEANGRAAEMRFDLAAHSRSWQVLINYLQNTFREEWQ